MQQHAVGLALQLEKKRKRSRCSGRCSRNAVKTHLLRLVRVIRRLMNAPASSPLLAVILCLLMIFTRRAQVHINSLARRLGRRGLRVAAADGEAPSAFVLRRGLTVWAQTPLACVRLEVAAASAGAPWARGESVSVCSPAG